MKIKLRLFQNLLAISLLFSGSTLHAQNNFNEMKVGPQPDGSILVPSNQLLRPAGLQIFMPGRPVDLVLTSNGDYLLVKNMKSLDLIRLSNKSVLQTLPFGDKLGASFTGICKV